MKFLKPLVIIFLFTLLFCFDVPFASAQTAQHECPGTAEDYCCMPKPWIKRENTRLLKQCPYDSDKLCQFWVREFRVNTDCDLKENGECVTCFLHWTFQDKITRAQEMAWWDDNNDPITYNLTKNTFDDYTDCPDCDDDESFKDMYFQIFTEELPGYRDPDGDCPCSRPSGYMNSVPSEAGNVECCYL